MTGFDDHAPGKGYVESLINSLLPDNLNYFGSILVYCNLLFIGSSSKDHPEEVRSVN